MLCLQGEALFGAILLKSLEIGFRMFNHRGPPLSSWFLKPWGHTAVVAECARPCPRPHRPALWQAPLACPGSSARPTSPTFGRCHPSWPLGRTTGVPPSPTEVLASLNFHQTWNLPLRFRDLELGKLHLKREVGQGTGVPLQGPPWPRLGGQYGVLPSGSLRALSLRDSHTPFRNSGENMHVWGAAPPRAQRVSRRARRHQV